MKATARFTAPTAGPATSNHYSGINNNTGRHHRSQHSGSQLWRWYPDLPILRRGGQQRAAVPQQFSGDEDSDQVSDGRDQQTHHLAGRPEKLLEGKEVEINRRRSAEKQVINKGTNISSSRTMEESIKVPMAYCPARPSSVRPRPMPAVWKRFSINSTRSTKASWQGIGFRRPTCLWQRRPADQFCNDMPRYQY